MRIAILEDDEHIGELLKIWIEADDNACAVFATGKTLINALKRDSFDIILLDWIVPDINGEEALQWIRENIDWHIPVVFVTARDSEDDIARILDVGADDYLVKPVRQKELLARIRALARRSNILEDQHNASIIEKGEYRIDTGARMVYKDNEPVKLTQKEYELVVFLFNNIGRIVSRSHIMESVWGHHADLNTRTADTHISRIRNKLGLVPENGWRINAIYHHGYRLENLSQEKSN
jgi:DNA-binding response OmpR family regulator